MKKWARLLYQPGTPLGRDGRRVTASEEHIALSCHAAEEGMVLLKNEGGILPFEKGTRVALLGKGTFDYVKGGGGSGDVTVSHTVNLYDGLIRTGYVETEEKTVQFYRRYVQDQYRAGCEPGLVAEPELPDELLSLARAFTDTAVISISRFSGEGWDRSVQGKQPPVGRGLAAQSTGLFERGDFYLSDAESAMVKKVTAAFPRVVVVLNVGGMVDSEWFRMEKRIGAVLMAWQGGIEGGTAAARLLCGLANPSGKLSDTFAKDLTDYPGTATFHESTDYVDYIEDIYVGYRYFETIPGAKERVNYPFGFGLSYTTFERKLLSAEEKDGEIFIRLRIINTGNRAGRETAQVYYSAPQGRLGKPRRVLCAFRKSRMLAPGEAEEMLLCFRADRMASYDDLGRICASAYVLEKGEYRFYVGGSVREAEPVSFVYRLEEDVITERLSARMVPSALKKRLTAEGTFEKLPCKKAENAGKPAVHDMRQHEGEVPAVRAVERLSRKMSAERNMPCFTDVAEGKMTLDEFISRLSDEEIAHLLGGQPNLGVANTWGFGNLPQYAVPNAMTADGPAGLRIHRDCGVCTTAFPCATLLACTWDPELACAVGEAGAEEVKENNIAMWLTPAVNIHRSPLCGRNFEYYSEDPYLAGMMAAGMVKGIQSRHISPAVKHFALNDKETNRKNSDSRVSERAIREIYLKAFEIIVKTAKPLCIMSSYNLINGCRASENRDMLTGILREEWGYEGMVCTDWWNYGEHDREVLAGNDLKMPTGFPEYLLEALEQGRITREDMTLCAKRILRTMLAFD